MLKTSKQEKDLTIASINDYHEKLDRDESEANAKTIKDFIVWAKDSRGVDEMLTIAVIEQFGVEYFLSRANDIANHGISGGFNGFISYHDTEVFYLKNKKLIITWAKDFHDSLGIDGSFLAMIAGYQGLKDSEIGIDDVAELLYSDNKDLNGFSDFSNTMTWVIAESVCYNYQDFISE